MVASLSPLRRAALFVLAGLGTRAALVWVPVLDVDEASYLLGARELLGNGRLYLTFADHKPPLVYVYYALAAWLPGGLVPVRLLTLLVWIPATAWAVSAFYRHDRRGLVAALAWLVFGAAFLPHDMHAVNCELLMMLPLAWGLVVAARGTATGTSHAAAAGLLLGVATLFKYQAAVWALPYALIVWRQGGSPARRGLRLALLAAGWTLPLVVTYAVFAARGSGDAFLYWNLGHNATYMRNRFVARRAAARFASYALPWALSVLPLAWAWWRRQDTDDRVGLVWGLAVSLAVGVVGWRFYPHYFIPAYLPLSLLAAPFVADTVRWPPDRWTARVLIASTVAVTAFQASGIWAFGLRNDIYAETRPVFGAVRARLDADPCSAGASLFVWGYAPQFYTATGLRPASRFVWVDSTLVGHVSAATEDEDDVALVREDHWRLLMTDLARNRPAFILDTAAARLWRWRHRLAHAPVMASFVSSGYHAAATVDGVTIYRRQDCAPAPR